MKNKKLFAILTLVCFLFTLMPVAAMAEDSGDVLTNQNVLFNGNVDSDIASSSAATLALRSSDSWYDADATELTISTVEELQEFALITQGNHATIAKDNFKGKIVKLGDDLDLTGTSWYNRDAEGTVTADYRITDFAGTFDGNGKTISNIKLNNSYDSGNSVGLCFFRSVTGSIKNLTLDGIDADSIGNASFYVVNSTMNNAGGYNTENVHVKNIDVYIDNDECAEDTCSQVAGMIRWHGGSGGTGPECRSKDCSVTNLNATVTGKAAVGGFSVFVAQRSWFDNCDVTNITFNIGSVEYGAGGFAGQVQSSSYVQRVFSDCDVTNLDITVGYLDKMVGGFLGNLGGMVDCDGCDVTGKITITSDVENAHVGGFTGDLGWQGDWSSDKKGHTFDNCTADVDITAVNSDVGGFVGMSAIIDDTVLDQDEAFAAEFTNCIARGDVTTVNGAAGGFVGSGDRGEYVSCTATGVVSGDIAGGFWGEVFSMPAAPANGNTGKGDAFTGVVIRKSIASEDVTGTTYEAGFIGYFDDTDNDTNYTIPAKFEDNSFVGKLLNASPDASNEVADYVAVIDNKGYKSLDEAIKAAEPGNVVKLIADVDYTGTASLVIDKSITLDLGGNTLTTYGTYGGIQLENGCTLKNGTLNHKGTVTAIKAWNVAAIEDLDIVVDFKAEGKVIGGIVIQSGVDNRIETIKNVTIKGDGLTNGIETYNCGDAAQDVIGSMEKVTIDAKGTGMLISAPCGTATNCDIKGGVSGIEIWIKGTYSAKLDLVDCEVKGGTQAVYAHDEFSSNPDIENNGTLELTADVNTTFTSTSGVNMTKTIARAENVNLDSAIKAAGKGITVNDMTTEYYSNAEITLDKATAEIAVGGAVQLTATVTPDHAVLTWSSSDATVATVDENGKVTAVGAGEATITVKTGDLTASCKVTVKDHSTPSVPPTSGSSGGGFSGKYNYPVNIADTIGANVTSSDNYAVAGETVTITIDPEAGKQVDEVIVTDADGDVITVSKVGDNKYSFTMPEGKVNVTVTTEAADYDLRIVMQINNKNIVVNNRTITNDVAPVIVGDRTLVPVRIVTELLGGTADWDDATRTVTLTIDGKVLKLVIDQPIPGFGTSATIINDRTYVPIRYVAEKLGANVEWIGETQQIIIEK